jgi:hypothetical protein
VLSEGLTFSQSTSTDVVPAVTAAPIADVYVGTTKGIYLYDAATTGKLTLAKATPDATPAGLFIGVTGKYLVTLGSQYIHTYTLSSTGVIGKQASSINTQLYNGGQCAWSTGAAVLDHTGQDLYVFMDNALPEGTAVCAAYQTFKINSTTGVLTFLGATIPATGKDACCGNGALAIIGNDKYAYAENWFMGQTPALGAFQRESGGVLQTTIYNHIDPPNSPPDQYGDAYYWFQEALTGDPTNHLAMAIYQGQPMEAIPYAVYLASYTVDGSGDITSTNTMDNMPLPDLNISEMNMSPAGNLLAIASNTYSQETDIGPGLMVYHFNGANPITPYSGIMTDTPIDVIHWDTSNHLYALSFSTKKLYIFTVTTTAITPVAGSPFTIPSGTPNALVVVPK